MVLIPSFFIINRPLSLRLNFLKTIYLYLTEAVLNHFNRVFELTLLCYLVSKLMSTCISSYHLINQLLNHGTIGFYWFFVHLPEISGILVTFQSTDYIRRKVSHPTLLILLSSLLF